MDRNRDIFRLQTGGETRQMKHVAYAPNLTVDFEASFCVPDRFAELLLMNVGMFAGYEVVFRVDVAACPRFSATAKHVVRLLLTPRGNKHISVTEPNPRLTFDLSEQRRWTGAGKVRVGYNQPAAAQCWRVSQTRGVGRLRKPCVKGKAWYPNWGPRTALWSWLCLSCLSNACRPIRDSSPGCWLGAEIGRGGFVGAGICTLPQENTAGCAHRPRNRRDVARVW